MHSHKRSSLPMIEAQFLSLGIGEMWKAICERNRRSGFGGASESLDFRLQITLDLDFQITENTENFKNKKPLK